MRIDPKGRTCSRHIIDEIQILLKSVAISTIRAIIMTTIMAEILYSPGSACINGDSGCELGSGGRRGSKSSESRL
jgi:hypothetical protein